MNEKISVIIPIYKVEKYLNRCIESIVCQTYNNLEIILVDDGSPDNCPIICDKWKQKDERIKVIHKENGGLSDARNIGLDNASGSYILFVDADDFIEKYACEKLYNTIRSTNTDFVVGIAKNVTNKGVSFQKKSNIEDNVSIDSKSFIISAIKMGEWYAPAWLNLYNFHFLEKNGLRFKKGLIHEDIEFLPRLFLAASTISYCEYPFYNYVIREESIMTSSVSNKRIEDTIEIYSLWKKQFDEISDEELRKYTYGNLVKQYLFSCRTLRLKSWLIPDFDFSFAFKYALNYREKIKVLFFELFPRLYVKR